MSEEKKEAKKLTAADLPELADDNSPSDYMYCRFFKQTWTGWEQTACSGNYSSEDSCRSAANSAGADAYSWTGNSC